MPTKNDTVETIGTLTVSSTTLSKILNVGDRRIRQYAEEGIVVKAARGKYELLTSVQKYIAFLKANKDVDGLDENTDLNYDDEHAKHEMVKRKIAEINLAKIQGEVHDAADVKIVMENMLSNFRTRVMGMPTKLAPILIARENINVIQSMIEKEAIEVLEELCDYDSAMFLGDEYIEIVDEEDLSDLDDKEKN